MTPVCRHPAAFARPVLHLMRSSIQTSDQGASLAVGLAHRCLRQLPTSSSTVIPTYRRFSQASCLRIQPAREVKPNTPDPITSTTSGPAKDTHAPHGAYALSLARKSVPTVLYESPRQLVLLLSSFAAGLTCLSAAAINVYFNIQHAPEGINEYVPVAFGAASLLMAAIGTKVALTPAHIVRSISVLPSTAVKRVPGAAATVASTPPPVYLEIKARRNSPIPGLPLKQIRAEPHEVVMPTRLYHPLPKPSAHQQMLDKQAEEQQRKEAHQYELNHIMTAPFRHAARAIKSIFIALRRGITGEGFAPIQVRGVKYKMDITFAYALEDGRALDRIVRIEEDPRLARLQAQQQGR
jgi:hypothetical protein